MNKFNGMFLIFAAGWLSLLSCGKGNSSGTPEPVDTTETFIVKPSVNGLRIAWDYSTLKKIAPLSGRTAAYCGYARVTPLYDGSLLAVYEVDGNIECSKSTDNGSTWATPVAIAEKGSGINMSAPDILELADHSILVSYNPRPLENNTDVTKRFAIRTKISTDGGVNWANERLLYEAGHLFQDGCWEPSQVQLPSGEIQLFFSNEGIYPNTDEQNISLLRSTDGGLSWTASPEMVSFRAGRRDGMPVPVFLANRNEIVFSIEDNNIDNFKPYIIRNTLADNWKNGFVDGSSAKRTYALAEGLTGAVYAGAPYLRQLRTRETILSYQSSEGRSSNTVNASRMMVAIGDESATGFNRKSEPFNVPANFNGLWNSLSVLPDNTVIAVTGTNAYSGSRSEVWMIKGYAIPELKASTATISVDGNLNETAWTDPFPVFIGHKGNAQARVAVAYDNSYLYIGAKLKDAVLKNESSNPEDDDALFVCIDAKNKSAENITRQNYKIILNADGRLSVKEGSKGSWVAYTGSSAEIKKSVQLVTGGYHVEMAIPWSLLGGKPAANARVGFNAGLINDDNGGAADYSEVISSTVEKQPFNWMPLLLQ